MAKRDWNSWPKRFKQRLDATINVFAVTTTGAGGLGILTGAPLVASAGFGAAIVTGAWCAIRSFPPMLFHPQEVIHKRYENLDQLDLIYPRPATVGFVGASGSGKTTLLEYLTREIGTERRRTDDLSAVISMFPGSPNAFFALLDGAGQQFSQQFRVVSLSEVLCVFLDHNFSQDAPVIDIARLAQHEQFLQQLVGHIQDARLNVSHVHLLLNKMDQWSHADEPGTLKKWFDDQVDNFRAATGLKVTRSFHSNFKTADKVRLEQLLRAAVLKTREAT